MLLKPFRNLFIILIISIFSIHSNAQQNAVTVRPINFAESLFGLSYERYITHNFSILVYGEYNNGPQLLWNGFNSMVSKGVPGSTSADLRYKGWAVIPEVRYYFKERDPKEPEVVIANDGKITGWFVGGYIPIRKLDMQLKINTVEEYTHARQNDPGVFHFNNMIYGFGVTGGRHWVWGLFSFEIQAGLAVTSGLGGFFDKHVDFTYTRSGVGTYTVNKDLGGFGTYMILMPRLGINMGIGF
jgi:hypothetical protein